MEIDQCSNPIVGSQSKKKNHIYTPKPRSHIDDDEKKLRYCIPETHKQKPGQILFFSLNQQKRICGTFLEYGIYIPGWQNK